MKQEYTHEEREKLLDLIIETAMTVHESGIQIAEKLGVPEDIVYDLRLRSPRAAMIKPCDCDNCKPGTKRRKLLKSMMKGFV